MSKDEEYFPSFAKMQGCGNSFLLVFEPKPSNLDWEHLSKRLLSSDYGIGSDGLFIIRPSMKGQFTISMYNRDGSRMGMCGNGIRCATRFLHKEGLLDEIGPIAKFEVEGREINSEILSDSDIMVNMGSASFNPKDIPINAKSEYIGESISVGERNFVITTLSLGNPHCVVFVDDLTSIDLEVLGPAIENHEFFPKRTNVEFVQRISSSRHKVKVWERGVGVTLACGTGACATVVAGVRLGLSLPEAEVELPGGILSVRWDEDSNAIYLTGPARFICSGKLSNEFFEDLRNGTNSSEI